MSRSSTNLRSFFSSSAFRAASGNIVFQYSAGSTLSNFSLSSSSLASNVNVENAFPFFEPMAFTSARLLKIVSMSSSSNFFDSSLACSPMRANCKPFCNRTLIRSASFFLFFLFLSPFTLPFSPYSLLYPLSPCSSSSLISPPPPIKTSSKAAFRDADWNNSYSYVPLVISR